MKTTALIAAAALTAAAGLAQAANDSGTTTNRAHPAAVQKDKDVKADKADKADKTANGESLGEKTKHAFQAMGQKIRSAGNRIASSTKKDKADDTGHASSQASAGNDRRNDTRSMGASRDNTK